MLKKVFSPQWAKTELLRDLDAAIAEEKPFEASVLSGLAGGKLSREVLQLYAAQYYRHVEAFPKHLAVWRARTEGRYKD